VKKIWILLLLLSLGLNLGLGLRLLRVAGSVEQSGEYDRRWSGRDHSRWERPAPGDSTAWRQFMGRRLEHLAQRLDLRPEQIEPFREAQQASFHLMRDRRRSLVRIRSHLRDLMAAAEIDRPAVRQAMAELGRRQVEVDSLAAETVLAELAVLDPRQRVRYLEFLPDRAGHRPGRGRFGQSPPGK